MTPSAHHHSSSSLPSLAVFIAAVVGIGLVVGYLTSPGEWYQSLVKPVFNPPNWIFGPVWTALYVLIAIAGWRIWRASGPESAAMKLWFAQMALNWVWSPAFFGVEMPWLAFAVIVVLLGTIIAFIVQAWERDRPAAWLFIPYGSWVAFAAALNGSIAMMN